MKFVFTLLLLMCAFVPVQAQTPAAPNAAMTQLASEVAAKMPLEEQIKEFTDLFADAVPEAKRALFLSIMKKNVKVDELRAAAVDALVKTYSTDELQTMKRLYDQPGSKEVIAKMDEFSSAIQPTIQTMVTKAIDEARKAGVLTELEKGAGS